MILLLDGKVEHVAAAVNKTGLLIWWLDKSKFIGYTTHKNIYVDIEGSPDEKFKHCNKCNDIMSVEMVSKEFSIMD